MLTGQTHGLPCFDCMSVPGQLFLLSALNYPPFEEGEEIILSKKGLIEWLKSGNRKTSQQIESESEEFLQKRN